MKYSVDWFRVDDLLLAEIMQEEDDHDEDELSPMSVGADYFNTFEAAREHYVGFLEDQIESYQEELKRLKGVETFEQYEEKLNE